MMKRVVGMFVAMVVPGLAVLAVPSAEAGTVTGPVTLTGVPSCDTTTGHQLVTWTLTNGSGDAITIDSAVVDGSGMTTPGPIDTTANLTPDVVLNGQTASGVTAVTGNGTGDLHLTVNYTLNLVDPTVGGEVVMPGGCVQATTTSSTSTSTSTTVASTATTAGPTTTTRAAAVVAATPRFTG